MRFCFSGESRLRVEPPVPYQDYLKNEGEGWQLLAAGGWRDYCLTIFANTIFPIGWEGGDLITNCTDNKWNYEKLHKPFVYLGVLKLISKPICLIRSNQSYIIEILYKGLPSLSFAFSNALAIYAYSFSRYVLKTP